MLGVGNFRALDSLWSRFKSPGDDERNWKTNRDQHDHQTHNPVRNFQEREYLGRNLRDYPADDRVCDRHFVNVAPFQLGKERWLLAHGAGSSQSLLNRGSFRSGCDNGFKRKSVRVIPAGTSSKCGMAEMADSMSPNLA